MLHKNKSMENLLKEKVQFERLIKGQGNVSGQDNVLVGQYWLLVTCRSCQLRDSLGRRKPVNCMSVNQDEA